MPYDLGAVLERREAPVLPRGGDPALRARHVPAVAAALRDAVVERALRLGCRRWLGEVPLFHHLRGRRIEPGALPLLVLEERAGRLHQVFIGPADEVLALRREARRELSGLLTELGLSWLVSVGRPCLDSHRLWDLRAAVTAEDVPVQDLETLLAEWPHDGAPRPTDYREVGDCACEGAHLLETLGVTAGDGVPWSASCSIDAARLAGAVLFQHGPDPERWPDPLLGLCRAG